jgi:hypothetical chaperone protein
MPTMLSSSAQTLHRPRYGLDFGTSNTSIAYVRDHSASLLPIDPANVQPDVMPTLIYFAFDQDGRRHTSIGRQAAIDYTGSGFKNERFIQSIKSVLSQATFTRTAVYGQATKVEEIVGAFLRHVKSRADAIVGQSVEDVVIGRPYEFVGSGGNDLAVQRLRSAARLAGFRRLAFELEPIGASLAYGVDVRIAQTILTFDFGGGTLDLSAVRIDPAAATPFRILGTYGIPVGGNDFTELIMRGRLAPHFGSTSTWTEQRLRVPVHIFTAISKWHLSYRLAADRRLMNFIEELIHTSDQPDRIRALQRLILGRHGWDLFQEIERAKISLSTEVEELIRFIERQIDIAEPLTRADFEGMSVDLLGKIDGALAEIERRARLTGADVDIVVLVGGSSRVPSVRRLLARRFPGAQIAELNAFTGVAAGLGLSEVALENHE